MSTPHIARTSPVRAFAVKSPTFSIAQRVVGSRPSLPGGVVTQASPPFNIGGTTVCPLLVPVDRQVNTLAWACVT